MKYIMKTGSMKQLAQRLCTLTGERLKYKGKPSCSYEIGDFIVEKDGTLITPQNVDMKIIEILMNEDLIAFPVKNLDSPMFGNIYTISIPRDGMDNSAIQSLRKLISAKETLMKSAFGIDDLRIEATDTNILFPWFWDDDPEELKVYTQFVQALCNLVKNQKRVTAKERDVDNPAYAWRCFLLRLGFIGSEHKDARKILMHNMPKGMSAFKSKNKQP